MAFGAAFQKLRGGGGLLSGEGVNSLRGGGAEFSEGQRGVNFQRELDI